MKKVIFIFLVTLCLFLQGCTQEEKTTQLLKQQGYKNIYITGYMAFNCGEDDWFSTGFTATAPNGERVSGVVCSGIFKGSTIRFH